MDSQRDSFDLCSKLVIVVVRVFVTLRHLASAQCILLKITTNKSPPEIRDLPALDHIWRQSPL